MQGGWPPDPRGVRRQPASASREAAHPQEINASGGNSAACHAQMYTMGTILRHGTDEQKERYLPAIAPASCGSRRSA